MNKRSGNHCSKTCKDNIHILESIPPYIRNQIEENFANDPVSSKSTATRLLVTKISKQKKNSPTRGLFEK